MNENRVDRRGFVKCGLAGLGLLAGVSPAFATFGFTRRSSYLSASPGTIIAPVPPTPLAFEVGSGVNPHLMVRVVQDYLAVTLSPEYAARVVQAQAIPRTANTFHQQFTSNYVIAYPLAPIRTRYGFFTSIDEVVRADGQAAVRPGHDLNYFELRRLIHPEEVNQFGVVLSPASYRQAPTPIDVENFRRIARGHYGIPEPDAFTVLYTRLFTNGRNSFVGFLASRGPDPVRSPFKDLLFDTVPVL